MIIGLIITPIVISPILIFAYWNGIKKSIQDFKFRVGNLTPESKRECMPCVYFMIFGILSFVIAGIVASIH